MPHLQGLARLVAADMIGMGGSDKLSPCGPDRYNYAEQRDYLFALWDALDLGDNVTLVLHDWGVQYSAYSASPNAAMTLVGRIRTTSSPGTPLRRPNSSARSRPM